MQKTTSILLIVPIILTACTTTGKVSPDGFIADLPEGVSDIAASYQDLTSVRIDPTTGCYVYLHDGPVENTFLPLRTNEGGPICTRLTDNRTAG